MNDAKREKPSVEMRPKPAAAVAHATETPTRLVDPAAARNPGDHRRSYAQCERSKPQGGESRLQA
jgi:hypothetical protein